jgi:hypothetical protein
MNWREVEGTVRRRVVPRREVTRSIEGEEFGAGFNDSNEGMGGISFRGSNDISLRVGSEI